MSPYRIQCWYLKNTEMQLQDIGQITSNEINKKRKCPNIFNFKNSTNNICKMLGQTGLYSSIVLQDKEKKIKTFIPSDTDKDK